MHVSAWIYKIELNENLVERKMIVKIWGKISQHDVRGDEVL